MKVPQNEEGNFFKHSASSDLPSAKKPLPSGAQTKTMNNKGEPGTSIKLPVHSGVHRPVLPRPVHKEHPSTSSEDESTDNDDDHGEGESGPVTQSARSHDSGRTVLYPDPYFWTNDEHWTMTPEAHKYAAAAGTFCFVTSAAYKLKSRKKLTVKPETCWNAVWPPVEKQQEQGPRGDPVHERKHQLRKYEDTTSSLLKRVEKSWIDNEVFDLVDLRKVKPKNYVTGRWVLTIKTDKAGQLPQGDGQMGTARFPRQAEGLSTNRFPTRPGFR